MVSMCLDYFALIKVGSYFDISIERWSKNLIGGIKSEKKKNRFSTLAGPVKLTWCCILDNTLSHTQVYCILNELLEWKSR